MKRILSVMCILSFVLCLGAQANRPRPAGGEPGKPAAEKPAPPPLHDQIVTTRHSAVIGGRPLAYTVTAGLLVMRNEEGQAKATIYFTAYTLDNAGDTSRRPLTFAFNGGPGSSSVWLHLGTLGPRRVQINDDGMAQGTPYQLVDNASSILDLSDIVFIDPVSTGYSRPAPGEDPKQFHGVEEDTVTVAEFIRLYLTRYQRWNSPKFLAGESYGTTRAASLSGYLQQSQGIYLNGIVLISAVLDFRTISFDNGNDIANVLYLPTYAATGWYHKRSAFGKGKELAQVLAEAERFADGEYAAALLKGSALTPDERDGLARKLADLTGLSADFWKRRNLRVSGFEFARELLADESRMTGRYDSRLSSLYFPAGMGFGRGDARGGMDADPSYTAIQGAFTAMLNHYLRTELNFSSDLPYEILTDRVRPWNYGPAENRYLNVAETLQRAMVQNPFLKVFVGGGWYDLATPYHAIRYTFNHLRPELQVEKRLQYAFFPAGHMFYTLRPAREKLKEELRRFYQSAVGEEK